MRRQVVFMLAIMVVVSLCTVVRSYGASQRWLSIGDGEVSAPVQVSIDQTLPESEPEIVVTVQGVFESRIDASDGRHYSQLSIPGCGSGAKETGHPEMPFKGFFLEIPYGVDVTVELLEQPTNSLGTGFLIYPQQPPIYPGQSKPDFQINNAVYVTDAFIPSCPVIIDKPGIIRGRRVVFVQVFPLQYNPVSTELRAFSSLRFKLRFKGTPDKNAEARKRRLATSASEAFAEGLIMNYESIAAEESRSAEGSVMTLTTADGADYLIIVADHLYEEILPLAEWKHKKGFITRVANMSEVGSDSNDVNDYIQNAYDTWDPAPSYVLLAGDAEDVPPQYYDGFGVDVIGPTPTDNLYSCVDGEDFYPDLTIGRLPVHTELECTNVVNKILTYDRDPDLGDWYDDFLSVSDSEFWEDEGIIQSPMGFLEISSHIMEFLETTIGMTRHTAWYLYPYPDDYHFNARYPHRLPYPDPVPDWVISSCKYPYSQVTPDISQAINSGVGLIQHLGHGHEDYWRTPPYDISDINALYNGAKTPVIFSISCATGYFVFEEGDSFCEAFLKKSPGGCVGIIGASDLSSVYKNLSITNGIYTCLWPSYDSSHTDNTYPHSWRPAEALTYGKYYMWIYSSGSSREGHFYLYHWFGDPEMMLRTETPQSLSVSYDPNAIFDTPVDVTVNVTKDSLPLEGALVAISHPTIEQDYWTGFTNASGSITFSNIIFSQCGNYDIVVTAHNCIPYEDVIKSCPVSDFDDDCDTDFSDFAILGLQWWKTPGEPSADIAPDGGDYIVDWLDLAVFTENWLAGVE